MLILKMLVIGLLPNKIRSTITNTIRRTLVREDMMKKSNNLLKSIFLHLMSETEQPNQYSFPTDLIHPLSMVQLSIKRSITASITRKMSLREEWTKRFTDLSGMLFHHSTLLKEVKILSFPTDLILLLSKVQLSIRRDIITSITRDQMLLRETWMKRFMDSSLTVFHHSPNGSTLKVHSSLMVQILLLSMVLPSLNKNISITKRIISSVSVDMTLMSNNLPIIPFTTL